MANYGRHLQHFIFYFCSKVQYFKLIDDCLLFFLLVFVVKPVLWSELLSRKAYTAVPVSTVAFVKDSCISHYNTSTAASPNHELQ